MIIGAKVVYDTDMVDDMEILEPLPDVYGEYRVSTTSKPLNLRQYPTVDADIIIPMSKGRTFTCYGFTDTTGDWYLGEYADKGKIYAGFAHKDYLTKKGV